jgi:hypothetical protein
MPFLSTSTRCNRERDLNRFKNPRDSLEQLKRAYKHPIIHEPATLDESYYHFEEDAESKNDKDIRNRNQIISKDWRRRHKELSISETDTSPEVNDAEPNHTADTGVKTIGQENMDARQNPTNQADIKNLETWPVLQVNQIWIWTVADSALTQQSTFANSDIH